MLLVSRSRVIPIIRICAVNFSSKNTPIVEPKLPKNILSIYDSMVKRDKKDDLLYSHGNRSRNGIFDNKSNKILEMNNYLPNHFYEFDKDEDIIGSYQNLLENVRMKQHELNPDVFHLYENAVETLMKLFTDFSHAFLLVCFLLIYPNI